MAGQPPGPVNVVITITVKGQPAGGLLASLATTGDFADESLSRRFYSIMASPPPELPATAFWGVLLREISGFLLSGDEPPDAGPDESPTG